MELTPWLKVKWELVKLKGLIWGKIRPWERRRITEAKQIWNAPIPKPGKNVPQPTNKP